MQYNASFRTALESIITHAGEIILSHQAQVTILDHKMAGAVVTTADIASEQYLIKELSSLLPEASWYAEESGSSGTAHDYCWVIDPLDGTTNFSHGFPHIAVSVALTYKGVPQIGVVYDPILRELFYAHKGYGAWLNGEPIRIPTQLLDRKLLLVATPYEEDVTYANGLQKLLAVGPATYAFRQTGSVALDCAYVAAGRADGLFFMDLPWWDIAAGLLILQEAGAHITGNGTLVEPSKTYPLLVAGSTELVHELTMQV